MSESMIASCVMSGCAALTLFLGLWLRSEKRVKALERDLRQCSEAVCQMIELQMREHRRLACSIDDIEERILGYAAPDIGSPKPVDRRHQVLTLSRKGLAAMKGCVCGSGLSSTARVADAAFFSLSEFSMATSTLTTSPS